MEKKKLAVLMPLLIAMAPVMAMTTIDVTLNSPSGETSFWEKTYVKGNYWPWPDDSQPRTPTAMIEEYISNEGSLRIEKSLATFGTGLQWPDINEPGEWSLMEEKNVWAEGETYKEKTVKVWTVHEGYSTDYYIYEKDVTDTMTAEFKAQGTIEDGYYTFTKELRTDEPLYETEFVFINPFSL